MDVINLLPVKTPDLAIPRPRSDASADQDKPGFSFANLLDEKNLPANEPTVAKNAPTDGGDGEAENSELLAEVVPTSETAELSTLLAMFSTMPCLPRIPIVATPVGSTSWDYDANTECQDTGSDVTPAIPGAGSSISGEATDEIVPCADQSRFDPRPREIQSEITGDRRVIRSNPHSPVIRAVTRAVKAVPDDISEPVARISPPGDEAVSSAPADLPIPAPTPQMLAGIAPALLVPPDPILREQNRPSSEDSLQGAPAQPQLVALKTLPLNSELSLRMLEGAGNLINFNPRTATQASGEAKGASIIPLGGIGPAVISGGDAPQQPLETVIQANQVPATIGASTFTSTSESALDALETGRSDFQAPRAGSPLPIVRTVQQPIVQTRFQPAGTIVPPEFDGTVTAMQEVAMPDPVKPHAPETKTVTLVGNSLAPQSTISVTDGRADIPVSALQRSPGSGTRQGDEGPAFQKQPDATFPSIPTNGTFAPPAAEGPLSPPVLRTEAETVIHRTMEAAERLRATGGERLEVQIRLDTGHELTVRLHLLQGEVKPVFVTESHELRRAIEENWAQFTDRSSDKSTRVTTPVFESPNSQSGMNDLNQRQREGRERAFSQAQDESFAGSNLPGRNPFRGPNAKPVAVGLPSGVQLYA